MKRRDLLVGLVGGAATFAAGTLERRTEAMPAFPPSPESRRRSGLSSLQAALHAELEEIDVGALQEGMEQGRWTAERLVEMYLDRVEQIDRSGPAINSVIEINPEAAAIAAALDRERAAGEVRGPLHGIPVMIKDNIDTADRMQTTAGSLALVGSTPPRDSWVAARLREAGAVILGKTNLSEWANFRSTRSSSGWSGRGGQTKNPYALDRNPCGSSSGSGVAAAASLCAVAIGTETDGSVVCPSSANGIVGIKPTIGLVGRSGIIPIAHSQDTAGPMARSVADAAILLGALVGVDDRDSATDASVGRSHTDYTQFLDPRALEGARIGVVRDLFGFHDRVDGALEPALDAMRRAGATLVDLELNLADVLGDAELEVLLYEFKADLNAYLEARGANVPFRSLADLIEFNEANRDREMPYFGQEIFIMAEEKGPLGDAAYQEALWACRRVARDEGIDRALADNDVAALVAPTDGPAWVTDLVNGDHYLGGSSTPAAVSGYAAISVPAGEVFGLPVGLSFFAGPWSEPTLIAFAFSFEQATGARRPPRYLPTADLG